MHNIMNALNATESFTLKWLILQYVSFISIKQIFKENNLHVLTWERLLKNIVDHKEQIAEH